HRNGTPGCTIRPTRRSPRRRVGRGRSRTSPTSPVPPRAIVRPAMTIRAACALPRRATMKHGHRVAEARVIGRRNIGEVLVGAVVLLVAAAFLGYAVAHSGRGGASGYELHASFDHIDGLNVGSDVKLAGVKVG